MQQSVTKAFEDYLAVSDLAAASVELKSRALRYFVDAVGNLDISQLAFMHAEKFKFSLVCKSRTKASANIYLHNIKPFFSWLFKRRYIEVNPFADIDDFKVGTVYREIYEPDEIERMMLCSDEYWQLIIALGLLSLRRSEILNLTVEDVFFDKGYILIREKRDSENTWAWQVKNHNQEIVPLPPRLQLKSYSLDIFAMMQEQIKKVKGFQMPYIFVKEKHYKNMLKMRAESRLAESYKNLPYNNFSRDFHEILRRAKVTNKRFHDLRATFATKMADHGMSLADTQKLMRHADPKTTATYYLRIKEQELIKKTTEFSKNYFTA